MAKNWTKALMGLALTGAAIGGAIAYKKHIIDADMDDEFSDDFEDEDFDLDADLEDVANREYVTLNVQRDTEESDDTAEKADDAAESVDERADDAAESADQKADDAADEEAADTAAE